MPRRMPERSNDVAMYMVLNDYRTGLAYVETAADEADRETVIGNFLSGQYSNALRVVAFNTAERRSPDVSRGHRRRGARAGYSMPATISRRTPSGSSTGTLEPHPRRTQGWGSHVH